MLLARDLAEASARATCEIAAGLRARFIGTAYQPVRAPLDAQGGAMSVDHPHVGAIALEPNKLAGAVIEARVIVTGDGHEGFEP
jgi:hypothetical protein